MRRRWKKQVWATGEKCYWIDSSESIDIWHAAIVNDGHWLNNTLLLTALDGPGWRIDSWTHIIQKDYIKIRSNCERKVRWDNSSAGHISFTDWTVTVQFMFRYTNAIANPKTNPNPKWAQWIALAVNYNLADSSCSLPFKSAIPQVEKTPIYRNRKLNFYKPRLT